MASLGHLNRGRQLGYLLLGSGGGGGGGVKHLLISSSSSSYTSSPSSWSLLSTWRGITFNCSSCNSSFTSDELDDDIKPCHHPLLSSTAPCLLIPSPKDKDEHEVIAASIAKEVGGISSDQEFGFPDYCFYSLADKKLVSLNNVRSKSNIVIPDHAICIGSSHGWLAYVDPQDRALFLTNPLDMVSPVPPTIRLPPLNTFPRSIERPFARWELPFIEKLVMSSAPSSDNNEDCTVVMVILSDKQGLGFCKIGDSSWTALENHRVYPTDVVYSSKDRLFYGRNAYIERILVAWNLRNPCSPRMTEIKLAHLNGLPDDYPESEKKLRDILNCTEYLVMESSCSGDVLVVTRYSGPVADDGTIVDCWNADHGAKYGDDINGFPVRTLRFDVYRLNAPKSGLDYVTDLGDGVVFVGMNHSFMLSARDFPPGVLIPNSIYFTFDIDELFSDMGIYNMRDFTVTPLFPSHLHLFNNIQKPPPIWFTPNPWNN